MVLDNKSISLFGVVNLPAMESIATEVLRTGQIANGKYVSQFEYGLLELLGQTNLVTTIDMTSAVYLALHLSGVMAGDEVITSAFACMSTNSSIATIGAKPIWVDFEKNSPCISVVDFEAAITPNTKAAILYHLAGYPGPAVEIAEICKKRNIKLIEDCNNALLATIEDKYVGSFGDFAVYSFYPNRQINTTEGGALVCKNPDDAIRAKKLRRFGIDVSTFRNDLGEINPAIDIPEIGWSITLNNFCSALGVVQIDSVKQRLEKTRQNANYLIEKLSEFSELKILKSAPNSNPAYWVLLVQLEKRDSILKMLKSTGVNCSQLHQSNEIYSGFTKSKSYTPNTTKLNSTIMAIPCGWWLTAIDIEKIISSIKSALKVYR